MKNLNKEKKRKSLYFFLFITLVPIIGIIIIFSYAFAYVSEEIDFITQESSGLQIIEQVEKSIFDIQKLRGLTCIKTPNKESIEYVKILKQNIFHDLTHLKQILLFIEKETPLRNELLQYIDTIQSTSLEDKSYEEFTQIINEFMLLSNRIAYQSKLILDSDLTSFVLIDNVVYLIPELIEYSGRIRAIASGISDHFLTVEQKEQIVIEQDKINERLNKLNYNKLFMYEKEDKELLIQSHKSIIETQRIVIELVNNLVLKSGRITIEPNEIYTLITNDIDLIINLYHSNLKLLNKNLEKRLKEERELSLLIFFIGFISIVFIISINRGFYNKNREYIDKIEELTITDSMTLLYNRRYFDEVFDLFLKMQQRTKQTAILIILDIDYFKQYNDAYGHQAGDLAIKMVAKHLKESLKRASDMAFRLGGEEFGILCTQESKSQALSFANEIRKRVEDEKFEHKQSSVSQYLTISMGVIEPKILNNIEEIYRYADEALYRAKEEGRNRVVMHESQKEHNV
jgi:diguanylate cyclase (GGDEF)-like protein